MKLINRFKIATRILLGKSMTSKPSSYEYHLTIDENHLLNGMCIMVTGATGAIGSAVCYLLAAMGAVVGICGRNKDKVDELIELILKDSEIKCDQLLPVVFDINNDAQIEESIKEFQSKTGKIDVFINNAGGQSGRLGNYTSHLYEEPNEQIDLILKTNLRGTIICSKIVSGIMAEQGYGHIISMASVIGINGKAGYCDYAATKAGIIGFTKSLALEMAEFKGRANCISPGLINQTLFDGGDNVTPTLYNALKRSGFTREIAQAIVFLICDEFITGQNIIVDGGRSLGLYGDH